MGDGFHGGRAVGRVGVSDRLGTPRHPSAGRAQDPHGCDPDGEGGRSRAWDEPVTSGDVGVGLVGGVGQRVAYGVEDGVPAGAEFLVAAVLGDGDDIAGVDGHDEGLGSEGGGVVPGADVQAGGAAVVSVVADLGAGHFHDGSGWVGDVPDVGGAVDGGAAAGHGVVVLVVLDAFVADEAAVGGDGHVPVGEPGEQLLAGFAAGVGGEVLHEADEAGVPVVAVFDHADQVPGQCGVDDLAVEADGAQPVGCLLYTSPSP